jgi:hypothetical protein
MTESSYIATSETAASFVISAVAQLTSGAIVPYAAETPRTILELFAAEPDSAAARTYRQYIRHAFVPRAATITALLEAHYSFLEFPPAEWWKTTYPDEMWDVNGLHHYLSLWFVYVQAWAPILADWEAGEFSIVRPTGIMMPLGGLLMTMEWSLAEGQKRQSELLGRATQTSAHQFTADGRIAITGLIMEANQGAGDST